MAIMETLYLRTGNEEWKSVRAGYTSWQKQTRSVDRAGYGLNYGKYYGGI